MAIQPRGPRIYGVTLMGLLLLFLRILVAACHGVAFAGEQSDNCYNYDFDEERRTALDECGHGYVPLSHSGTRHDEHWTNNNLMKRDTFIFCKLVWVIEE